MESNGRYDTTYSSMSRIARTPVCVQILGVMRDWKSIKRMKFVDAK
jgi:hypothetical protein